MLTQPPPLGLQGVWLSQLARRHGLELRGPDGPVRHLARIKASRADLSDVLTYITAAHYVDGFVASGHEAAIIERRFWRDDLPADRAWLVCDQAADEVFFSAHIDLVEAGRVQFLQASRGSDTAIHPAAVVMDHVQIGDGVRIDAGAVLYPNTVIADGVHVKANATIGGEGFEAKVIGGRRRIIPHTGGVFVDTGAAIGSSTCVDRGLFGTMTAIGACAQVDNLVHVAHNVVIGPDSGVVACAEISGSCVLGRGVWFGPRACCNHELTFGDYAYVGTGSVVTRSVPAHALVFGAPAKQGGWACICRNRISDFNDQASCGKCGTRLIRDAAGNVRIAEP